MSTSTQSPGAIATSQIVTLPPIPELFDPNFLEALIPVTQDAPTPKGEDAEVASNAMMDALRTSAHQKLTTNSASAFSSTLLYTLDAYLGLRTSIPGEKVDRYLENAWAEDPSLTLRIIWSTRSIHHGKGEKELFYRYVASCFFVVRYSPRLTRAFGWLFETHPLHFRSRTSHVVQSLV
jgi:hypothetical protein